MITFRAAFIVTGIRFIACTELSGGEARILFPRKHAAPPVCEIEKGHVEHEHRVMTSRLTPKDLAQRALGIAVELFRFHFL
jgi:hypothetical protein